MNGLPIEDGARRLAVAFAGYNADFRAVTRRAQSRFEARDWHGSQQDAVERIDLYDLWVDRTVTGMRTVFGGQATDRDLWRLLRDRFLQRSAGLPDTAFARTFFSSVSRRLFGTVGVDEGIEFAAVDLDPLEGAGGNAETRLYSNRGDLGMLVEDLLDDLPLKCPWIDFERSVRHVTADIATYFRGRGINADAGVRGVEMLQPIFFQSTRAYLVGRLDTVEGALPFVLALQHTEPGLSVDAVMLDEDDASVVFGFTRSYFHVDIERVVEAVVFLRQLLPRKPLSELFTVLGRVRQGKTERYRELMRHLGSSDDQFEHAAGERGLVMICFTLPSLDVVFKLIRDRFPPVKTVVRQDVLDKYQFVFRHDRAGRLVDAQEFKRVRLPLAGDAPVKA